MLWLKALLLGICLAVCAQAQSRTLALYEESPRDLNSEATAAMRGELQRLLAPAGLELVWRHLSERRTGENFDLVAVTSIAGSCAVDKPAAGAPYRAALADTSIVDGHILPFFRIDCRRLVAALGSQDDPAILGRALARVAAHEIYHIV